MAKDDITAMPDWLKKRKISEDVVKTLVKEGYTSMEALAMLTGEDISDINAGLTKTQKILQGQHKLLLNVVVQLRPKESPATKQDPYVAMMGLLQQKQQVRSEPSDVQINNDGPTPRAVTTATPATSEACQWSWMDP